MGCRVAAAINDDLHIWNFWGGFFFGVTCFTLFVLSCVYSLQDGSLALLGALFGKRLLLSLIMASDGWMAGLPTGLEAANHSVAQRRRLGLARVGVVPSVGEAKRAMPLALVLQRRGGLAQLSELSDFFRL